MCADRILDRIQPASRSPAEIFRRGHGQRLRAAEHFVDPGDRVVGGLKQALGDLDDLVEQLRKLSNAFSFSSRLHDGQRIRSSSSFLVVADSPFSWGVSRLVTIDTLIR